MKEYFTKQLLKHSSPITQEQLDKMMVTRLTAIPNPTEKPNDAFIPHSCFGRPYEVGDILLYFMKHKMAENFEGDVSVYKSIHPVTLGELDKLEERYHFLEYDKNIPIFEDKFSV